MVTLGDNIRKARKKMGLTQEEVASVIGVTSQAVSRWESGSGMPDISLLVPLAQTLSVSIDSIFGYEQQERSETTYIELSRKFEDIEKKASSPLEDVERDLSKDSVITVPTGVRKLDEALGGGLDG